MTSCLLYTVRCVAVTLYRAVCGSYCIRDGVWHLLYTGRCVAFILYRVVCGSYRVQGGVWQLLYTGRFVAVTSGLFPYFHMKC